METELGQPLLKSFASASRSQNYL